MNERDRYIDKIRAALPERDILEAIAEEAAEIAQAAIKMIRAQELSKNRTPAKPHEAIANLQEEILDLLITLDVWEMDLNSALIEAAKSRKWRRWAERLEGRN